MAARRKGKQPPLPTLTEKQEALYADRAAEMMGYRVVKFSQPFRAAQTRGIPDRLYVHPVRKLAVWAELKAEKGKPSPHQMAMHQLLSLCGQHVVCGTANTVGDYLVQQLKSVAALAAPTAGRTEQEGNG